MESTCAALGSYDGVHYYKDPECLECVKDLIRFLRRDDATHVIRRVLGNIGVVSTDLIPLLREYSNDEELFDLVLRLLVNLTGPELLLFREELPEEKVTRNYFIELQTYRQKYKQSFIDEKLWAILAQSLGKLLKKGIISSAAFQNNLTRHPISFQNMRSEVKTTDLSLSAFSS